MEDSDKGNPAEVVKALHARLRGEVESGIILDFGDL
jgi:hypothetical protein